MTACQGLDDVVRQGAWRFRRASFKRSGGNAGGEELYNPEQQGKPETWQPFTDKFISQVHSMSVVDVEGKTLRLMQVSDTGEVVDSFRITK